MFGVKKGVIISLGILLGVCSVTGCGKKEPLDISVCQTDISEIKVPDGVKIVGLGEASHGCREYQQLKQEVFQSLVENQGCKTFILEGDFGGCLKVDDYIHGGALTQGMSAEEAIGEIGFAIYRTAEMADLVDWMRSYNETAAAGADLHFYGIDMQRYDNNKEFLFQLLKKADSDLSKTYEEKFAALTDEARPTLDSAVLQQSITDAETLLQTLTDQKEELIAALGETEYELAKECAHSIQECSQLCDSGMDYNTLRDGYMAQKLAWYADRGDDSILFVTGHNGHISKTSGSYACLGSLLEEQYGEGYFAIGTDAAVTEFQSQSDNGFTVLKVKNNNALTAQAAEIEGGSYFLDFRALSSQGDAAWQKTIQQVQPVTALNVGISAWQQFLPMFYTQKVVPAKAYDGMIFFDQVTPTTIF